MTYFRYSTALPDDARQALMTAAHKPPSMKAEAIDKATADAKEKYPHLFLTKAEGKAAEAKRRAERLVTPELPQRIG